jgi:hypothetical protein
MRGRLYTRIRAHAKAALIVAATLQLTSTAAISDDHDALGGPDSANSEVIERIIGCSSVGTEAVLLREGVECKDYRQGEKFLDKASPEMPLGVDADRLCSELTDLKDWRRLPGNAIKRIVRSTNHRPDPRGIRILGAIFCEAVDLSGLDLSYALVMDRSVFLKGFEARNLHMRGDLSFDGSLALDAVTIMRSRIEGTVFGSDAYIKALQVLDSEIQGSLLFRRSMIAEPAIFDTVAVSGELSVRETSLSYLRLQFSKVGGVLDLTGAQARCAYRIMKSEIGDLIAVETGFGTSAKQQPGDPRTTPKDLFDWRLRPNSEYPLAEASSGPRWLHVENEPPAQDKRPADNKRECKYWSVAFPATFLLSDTRVKSSLCLRSFHWLLPKKNGRRESTLTFNNLTVDATSFIDLALPKIIATQNATTFDKPIRKFEAVGLKTNSFIFNFDEGARVDRSVGGLVFDHAYSTRASGVAGYCAYDPNYYSLRSGSAGPAPVNMSEMRVPKVDEITDWLHDNCLQTSQPLSAFIDLAKKTGDVTAATELQIKKEDQELGLRIVRLYGIRIFGAQPSSNCGDATPSNYAALAAASPDGLFWKVLGSARDTVAVAFGGLMRVFADYGYRPQKVLWIALAVLVLALAYLRLWARVVGFRPVKKSSIRPIGWAFLFDRMLPAYHIREDHYNVEAYYKLAFRTSVDPQFIRYMNYLVWKIPLVKADDLDKRRVESCLEVLKWVGIGLSIFLAAAINALFKG